MYVLKYLDGVTRNTRRPDSDADVPFGQVWVAGGGGPVEAGDGEVVIIDGHELAMDGNSPGFDETNSVGGGLFG